MQKLIAPRIPRKSLVHVTEMRSSWDPLLAIPKRPAVVIFQLSETARASFRISLRLSATLPRSNWYSSRRKRPNHVEVGFQAQKEADACDRFCHLWRHSRLHRGEPLSEFGGEAFFLTSMTTIVDYRDLSLRIRQDARPTSQRVWPKISP